MTDGPEQDCASGLARLGRVVVAAVPQGVPRPRLDGQGVENEVNCEQPVSPRHRSPTPVRVLMRRGEGIEQRAVVPRPRAPRPVADNLEDVRPVPVVVARLRAGNVGGEVGHGKPVDKRGGGYHRPDTGGRDASPERPDGAPCVTRCE